MTPEDEAFDELARRQGGGFPAKRAMAKARVEEDDDIQDYKRPWVNLIDDEIALIHASHPQEFARALMAKLKERNS
jgi:hypothetical protein